MDFTPPEYVDYLIGLGDAALELEKNACLNLKESYLNGMRYHMQLHEENKLALKKTNSNLDYINDEIRFRNCGIRVGETVIVDGVECTVTGVLGDAYRGENGNAIIYVLRNSEPMETSEWVKKS